MTCLIVFGGSSLSCGGHMSSLQTIEWPLEVLERHFLFWGQKPKVLKQKTKSPQKTFWAQPLKTWNATSSFSKNQKWPSDAFGSLWLPKVTCGLYGPNCGPFWAFKAGLWLIWAGARDLHWPRTNLGVFPQSCAQWYTVQSRCLKQEIRGRLFQPPFNSWFCWTGERV